VPSPLIEQLTQLKKDYETRSLTQGASLKALLREREAVLSSQGSTNLGSTNLGSIQSPQYSTNPLGTIGSTTEISSAMEQASAMVNAPVCPILAVVGMLNAGKSSLVATFLSADEGLNDRVLIGSANTEGTHRFVLWLPESWRTNPVIWQYITQRLTHIFNCTPEMLDSNPTGASRQYNDLATREVIDSQGNRTKRHAIEIPLVATDPQLDRLGIALMDCPDVQTGLMSGWDKGTRLDELAMAAARVRFDVLERASALCGAFVLVLPANAMHDQTVSRLLKMLEVRMPHVQRILAVNRVPRKYDALEISEEMQRLYGMFQPSRIYMAYHFHGPERRDRLTAVPAEMQNRFVSSSGMELPAFFRIDLSPVPQPPNIVQDNAWMLHLGEQLEGNVLLADAIESSLTTLKQTMWHGLQQGRSWIDESNKRLESTHRLLTEACLDFSIDPSSSAQQPKIRLQASRKIVEQIAGSLERTAPWWARPGRWVQRLAQASKESVGYATSWVKMPTWMIDRGNSVGQWVRTRFQRGEGGKIVTSDALVEALRKRDHEGLLGLDGDSRRREAIKTICQRAIDRFQAESATQLDAEQVDQLTKRLWEEMPMSKRILNGVAPAGILFAPLLAVIMIPLDFGGSSVLVFASLKELLFAGAAGFGLVLASSDSMPQMAENESAWQQLFDLVAVLTDELGLERRVDADAIRIPLAGSERKVGSSTITVKTQSGLDVPGLPKQHRSLDEIAYNDLLTQLEALQQNNNV